MASFKRIAIGIGAMLLFAQASLAQTKPVSYQSLLERTLDNHRVINIVDDFLVYWDQAQDKTLAVQRRLWKRLVENRHRDYFDRAVYRTSDPKTRRAMLDDFLIRVPSQIESIREFNNNIFDLRASPLIEAYFYFRVRFPEYQQRADIYVGLSMFRFDGAVRPVQNEEGVPDTLCLGAEVLSGYTREQTRIAIAHEFFHLYHFGFLFRQLEQNSPAEFRIPHMPLMIEGMAVAGAEQVFPNEPRELYLRFTEEELAAGQRDLPQNAGRFLDLIREGASPEEYEPWFKHSYANGTPPRGGYLLGYEVTRRVMAAYGLERMVRMTPAELREHAEEQLEVMTNERILLMAAH
jgi:hypothetical protein